MYATQLNDSVSLLRNLLNVRHRPVLLSTCNTLLFDVHQRSLANIDSIVAIEELGDFLHGRVPGFHNTEVDDANLKSQEDTVADVVLPRECVERNTVDKLVEEESCCNAEVEPCESLGAKTIWQDFGSVSSHDTGLDIVEDTIEELHVKVSTAFLIGPKVEEW